MGFFSDNQKQQAESVYEQAKKYLVKKDGLVHIAMINSFSKWINQIFGCDDKYTTQINEILTSMQKDGYEIIDVKFNSVQNQGVLGQMEGFHTVILYR